MTIKLFDYQPLIRFLRDCADNFDGATLIADALPDLIEQGLCKKRYGDLSKWQNALEQLPDLEPETVHLDRRAVAIQSKKNVEADQRSQLLSALQLLIPWRKGPFNFFEIDIDTEWRSDLKWERVAPAVAPLEGRRVLDVGCGSGYHCWRIAGEGAQFVLGIDPTPLFVCQYWAVQKYMQNEKVWVVPARMEQLPKSTFFDTVFSMGVLYHRRSPLDHLQELKDALFDGGQLVLETLVVEGGKGKVLVPEGRYSKMGNVWFLPSVPELCNWLGKLNFKNIEVVDVSVTTVEEQRSTDWMRFQSLVDFLAPDDNRKTIEGYPAPRRAVVTATV